MRGGGIGCLVRAIDLFVDASDGAHLHPLERQLQPLDRLCVGFDAGLKHFVREVKLPLRFQHVRPGLVQRGQRLPDVVVPQEREHVLALHAVVGVQQPHVDEVGVVAVPLVVFEGANALFEQSEEVRLDSAGREGLLRPADVQQPRRQGVLAAVVADRLLEALALVADAQLPEGKRRFR